jgi:integrase/recombinase XerD
MLHMNGTTTDAETQHPADNGAQVARCTNVVGRRRCPGRGRRAMPRRRVLTLQEVASIYYEDCRVQGYTGATIKGYQRTLCCFLRWATAEDLTTLADFTAPTLKRYIAHVQQRAKWTDHTFIPLHQERVSATTVRNYVRDLKAFASWLEREEYTAENVLARVRKPKADDVPIAPFTQEELDRMFGAFDLTDAVEMRDYVLLHTLWDTGMRVGELAALTLDDVDLKTCEIRIAHAKWGKWRDIGFGKQTQKFLSRYVSVCRPHPAIEGDRAFFLAVDGYPLSVGAIEHMCHRISKRTGIRIHPHRFRHTFAVGMLRNGTDIRTLQKLMGHASVQILVRYLNLANDEALEAHRVNSPADRHYQQKLRSGRRLPMRYRQQLHAAIPESGVK